jgi:hypothetical protein
MGRHSRDWFDAHFSELLNKWNWVPELLKWEVAFILLEKVKIYRNMVLCCGCGQGFYIRP